MLTTNPIYWKPYLPRIDINNLANNTTYYSFDPFADITTNKVVYARVDLGIDHHGSFEIQIENSNQGLDTTNIKKGQRVFFYVKKDSTLGFNTLISGLIRKTGYSRGIGGQALYNISGSSTAIRFNERITYFVREAIKLAQDNLTIDITDPNMKADTLLQSLLNITEAYNASTIASASDVENFIPSIAIEFGELQDGINAIEDQSNGECFVGPDDFVIFRHQLQATTAGRGFVLKDTMGTTDDASWTGYIDATPEYSESIYKSDGFASRLYGILPTDTVPSNRDEIGYRLSSGSPTSAATTVTQEIAAKFRPTHSHFLPGDVFIVGSENASAGSTAPWITRYRICLDNGGVPANAGGVIANIDFQPSQFQSPVPAAPTDESFVAASDQIFFSSANARIDSFDLDTTKNYWLICSNDNLAASHQFNWAGNLKTGAVSMVNSTAGLSTNSAGGSGWVAFGGATLLAYALPRRRSIAFECSDSKAIAATGSGHTGTASAIIESTQTNIPATVKTIQAIYKHLSNQLYYMARPQLTWSTLRINPPNNPILPNDPLMIVDSTLGFSTSGNQVMTATTGAMTYEFGSRGGDGNSLQSSLYLNITPVGFATHYN